MKNAIVWILVVASLSLSGLSRTIPGRWEKVDALVPQTEMRLKLESGEKLYGRFLESNARMLRLDRLEGGQLEIPKDSIQKIVLTGEKRQDPVWNGLAIGAASGAASYLIGHAALCCAPDAAHDAVGALFFGAIGMGVGALIDASVRSEEVVYKSR